MRKMLVLLVLLLFVADAYGEAGVLFPTNVGARKIQEVVKLRKMVVRVNIEEQHAFVTVLQLYENLTDTDIEGKYVFALPSGATITDFAIWEDGVRVPAVVMERHEASRTYEKLTASKIDPGLAEAGTEEGEQGAFVVRVYPIPAHGVKRIELSYEQTIEVTGLSSAFTFPLHPASNIEQSAEEFQVEFSLTSSIPVVDFICNSKTMNFEKGVGSDEVHSFIRVFRASNFSFSEDVSFTWRIREEENRLDVWTYRDAETSTFNVTVGGGREYRDEAGYFLARLVLASQKVDEVSSLQQRDIIVALDTSLSMKGFKLESAFNAVSYFLENLNKGDRFSVVMFNDEVTVWQKKPVEASSQNIQSALSFIRQNYLQSGTDLWGAIQSVSDMLKNSERGKQKIVIMITDGNPTASIVSRKKLLSLVAGMKEPKPRFFIFSIGTDTDTALLNTIAYMTDGYHLNASETEDLGFKLKVFFNQVGAPIIGDIKLGFSSPSNFTMVYPALPQKAFTGSAVEYVGKYLRPMRARVSVLSNSGKLADREQDFPQTDRSRSWIKRVWARERVSFLLDQIRLEGEQAEWVEEIIALAKEFKFVTPYTSFIAAPRALLRPRVIKPRDPILRVRTDHSVVEVVAIFPFGLVKNMRKVEEDPLKGDVWETRFLAPRWMNDGVYKCLVVLYDESGRITQEIKEFVIDSKPPQLKAVDMRTTVRAGDTLEIKILADADTRWIRGMLAGTLATDIRWDAQRKMCVGVLRIPHDFPPGLHELVITAEDFAHNTNAVAFSINVAGGAQ